MNFGIKLQNLRKEKKLSQEQLAEKLNVSRQAVSKWESNQSYPEMEKLIEMTKIFGCTLDDLTNDETTSESINQAKQKNPVSDIINDITNIINKSINMFTDMKGDDIFKLIFIMFLVAVGISILKWPINEFYHLCVNIFVNFGSVAERILSSIVYLILNVTYICGGVLLFFYIYKAKYLDKYDSTKKEVKETINEEPQKEEFKLEKKEPVIETKKDTTKSWTIFKVLGKIVMFFVKMMALFMAIPFICSFVIFTTILVVAVWLIIKGVVVIGVIVLMLSFLLLTGVVLELIFALILSKKPTSKRIFINFILGLLFFGAGIGILSIEVTDYKFYNEIPAGYKTKTMSQEFAFNKDLYIGNDRIEYIEDNTLKNTFKVEVEYYDGLSTPYIDLDNNNLNIYSADDEWNFDVVNNFIGNLKHHNIYNYALLTEYKIKIYISKTNLDIVKANIVEEEVIEDDYDSEITFYEEKIAELETEIEDLTNNQGDELNECQDELAEYQQTLEDLLN